jgi:hypothetical protein
VSDISIDAWVETIAPIVADIIAIGRSARLNPGDYYIATMLNQRGVPARRGGRWHATSVMRLWDIRAFRSRISLELVNGQSLSS